MDGQFFIIKEEDLALSIAERSKNDRSDGGGSQIGIVVYRRRIIRNHGVHPVFKVGVSRVRDYLSCYLLGFKLAVAIVAVTNP